MRYRTKRAAQSTAFRVQLFRTQDTSRSQTTDDDTVPSGNGRERRRIQEPYRQAFGRVRTRNYGRPAGWILLLGAVEKIGFPVGMLLMIIFRNWYGLFLTMAVDTFFCVSTLAIVMKGQRIEYLAKGLAVTPVRYAGLAVDLVSIVRFVIDIWITRSRRWRK